MRKDVFDQMGDRWPSAVVARTEVDKFSGGLLKSKTMANMDCQGIGPSSIQMGRKIGYPVDTLVQWLRDRAN